MKYINRVLNFSDGNLISAQNLLISKEMAKGLIEEIQTEYVPKEVIKIKIKELKEQMKVVSLNKDLKACQLAKIEVLKELLRLGEYEKK